MRRHDTHRRWCATWCSAPGWRRAPGSATTASTKCRWRSLLRVEQVRPVEDDRDRRRGGQRIDDDEEALAVIRDDVRRTRLCGYRDLEQRVGLAEDELIAAGFDVDGGQLVVRAQIEHFAAITAPARKLPAIRGHTH